MNSNPETMQQPQEAPSVFNRKLRWFGIIIGILAIACVSIITTSGLRRQWSLESAVHGADRLLVSRAFFPGRNPLKDDTEISGADAVAEFLGLIDIDEKRTIPAMVCKCFGDVLIEFRRGDQELARIGYAHGNSLKWFKGNWSGDSTLTQESAAAIASWLNQHAPPMVGPPAPKKGS